MSCYFCKKPEKYEIMQGIQSAGFTVFSGIQTCKAHAKKGKELAAKKIGGRPGVHTRAQRIGIKAPEKK